MSELMDNSSQIELLHKKASEGDFLSRFNYEYLSFITYLNNNLYPESLSNEESILKLKKDKVLRAEYMALIFYHRLLKKVWNSVIEGSQTVQNLQDWENMIEFWYSTSQRRCNGEIVLKHAEDQVIVEQAYYTLSYFMNKQIKNIA